MKCFKICHIFGIRKPKEVYLFFIIHAAFFSPNKCHGLCRHRPGHSLGKNKMAQNEKNYMGFCIPKLWQILKHFARAFRQAQTSYF